MSSSSQSVLIIDFGSQYTQLIARRVRELGVYCELMPYDVSPEKIIEFAPNAVILSGGPESTLGVNAPAIPAVIFDINRPILGICYGMQSLAKHFGGEVASLQRGEFGSAELQVLSNSQLLVDYRHGTDESSKQVWMSHGDQIVRVPVGFTVTARTTDCEIVAMEDAARNIYALLFHLEVTHTTLGLAVLRRFLFDICGCSADWTPAHIVEQQIQKIRAQVGNAEVILGLSGGVDSAVAAALIHRAIGSQLQCLFIDNGLLRTGEAEQVQQMFSKHFGMRLQFVDASKLFLQALFGITDPEQKRKIIGRLFVEVFQQQAKQFPRVQYLAQGTIYPDVIESAVPAADGTAKAASIKSHHNVGGLPESLRLKLLEPLRELFKDEVRQVGLQLGLPQEWIYRQPFPGPGLAVRVLGEIKEDYLQILRHADAIFQQELATLPQTERQAIRQAFAVFLPIKTVGVVGDARRYAHVITLRAVTTDDFMTAQVYQFSWPVLLRIANRIVNEIAEVARVVYDISSKPPATIEWE